VRIVGGSLRGRLIAAPEGSSTRPTSDRVREAVFNILAHGIDDFALESVRVLDLFAGTGALGLEALSRGAASCLFVEEDATARGTIRRNIETLGLAGRAHIYRRDATRLGEALPRERCGLVFADPPYGKELGEKALHAAGTGRWLDAGAVAVLEERADVSIRWPDGFEHLEARTWGDTAVHIARWSGGTHE
jgi:16S rRNA (guanine966-N2)-methyltransferase